MSQSHPASNSPARVVVFMTHERPADVPGEEQRLACLQPMGSASFVERVMDSCALAGIRDMDVVISEHPEAVRQILQDGAPWGIRIHWHHAKDSASPYKVLRGMALDPAQRIVMGHAHQWVASRVVSELAQCHGVALQLSGDVAWAGWFSTDAATVDALGPHQDYESLTLRVRGMQSARCVIAQQHEHAQCLNAADLLNAQQHAPGCHWLWRRGRPPPRARPVPGWARGGGERPGRGGRRGRGWRPRGRGRSTRGRAGRADAPAARACATPSFWPTPMSVARSPWKTPWRRATPYKA